MPAPPTPEAQPSAAPAGFGWKAAAAFWLGIALFFYSQVVMNAVLGKLRFPWREVAARSSVTFAVVSLVWLAGTPLIVWVARRWPFRRGGWMRPLLAHAAAGTVLVCLTVWVRWELQKWASGRPFLQLLVYVGDIHFFVFAAAAGAVHAARYLAELRRREVEAAELERGLAAARVEGMRRRVDPDLLFAALDDAAGLVRRDPARADRLITALGGHLRAKATAAGRPLVPLRAELAVVEAWAEVRAARAGRADVRLAAADDALLDAPVPPFVLQPLVEHVLASASAADVSVAAAGERLRLEVRGLGPTRPADRAASADGDGPPDDAGALSALRARLAELYDGSHALETGADAAGRAVARVLLPLPSSPR